MRLPRPPTARIATLPRRRGDKPQETAVAVNPRDPNHVIVSYHQAVGDGSDHEPGVRVEVHVASTFDAGETWSVADAYPDFPYAIDAVVALDLRGHAYLVNMGRVGTAAGEYLRRSLDGGRTWQAPVALSDRPGEHMPKIVTDSNLESPYAGNVYVTWDRMLGDGHEEMVLVRSTDGGETWTAPEAISRHQSPTLPAIAVGPEGNVYVACVEAAHPFDLERSYFSQFASDFKLIVQVSRDGGETFHAPVVIAHTRRVAFGFSVFPRAVWIPTIGVDPSGRVFAVWADATNGQTDVFCSTSEDSGSTWGRAIRVNDDPADSGAAKVLQYLAVDPVEGAANILFYDCRSRPDHPLASVVLARSTDGGRTFANYALGEEQTDPALASLGDYIGLAALDGRVYGVWPEYVSGETPAEASLGQDELAGKYPSGPAAIKVGIADFRAAS
jgi:hypothetical protein